MDNATDIITRLEHMLQRKHKLAVLFQQLDGELGGAAAKVAELQTELRREWNSKRLWAHSDSPDSVAMRDLLDRLEILREALQPERQSVLLPPNYLPGNSPFGTSVKMDATKGIHEKSLR